MESPYTTYLHFYIYIYKKLINYINNCPVNGAIEYIGYQINIHPSSPIFHKGFCWNWVSPTSPAPGKGKGWKQVPAQEPNLMRVSLSIDPSICLSLHLSTYKYLCVNVYIYIYIVSLPLSLSLSPSAKLLAHVYVQIYALYVCLHALGAFVRLCAAIAYIYIYMYIYLFIFSIYLCMYLSIYACINLFYKCIYTCMCKRS